MSRTQYLDRVIESLLKQTYKPTSFLVIYDGPENEFVETRNKIVGLDFKHVLFVKSTNTRQAFAIPERRQHIVNIHNQIREIIEGCDWVFSMEDDSVLPPNALQRLVELVKSHEDVGMATGVELGRWGVPYVGAWKVDDINNVTEVTSMQNRTLDPCIETIDACGLYCALIRADHYKQHEFFTHNGLGPDVNLALFLRQQGLRNYIDWSIHVTHLTSRYGLEVEIPATDISDIVTLRLLSGTTWQALT